MFDFTTTEKYEVTAWLTEAASYQRPPDWMENFSSKIEAQRAAFKIGKELGYVELNACTYDEQGNLIAGYLLLTINNR